MEKSTQRTRSGREAARNVDVVGLLCPLPLRIAEREIRTMHPGDLLVLRGDDPALRVDVPAWCARRGHRLVELTEERPLIRAIIEKGGSAVTHSPSRGT